MRIRDYTATIEVARSPEHAFRLVKEVSKWWTNNFQGSTTKLNDEFTIRHGPHYSRHKLIEIIPDKRLVWLVTDSSLDWLEKDKEEWTGTKLIFDLFPAGDKTEIRFTHEGLVPEKECYDRCTQGWDIIIKDWLFNLVNGE